MSLLEHDPWKVEEDSSRTAETRLNSNLFAGPSETDFKELSNTLAGWNINGNAVGGDGWNAEANVGDFVENGVQDGDERVTKTVVADNEGNDWIEWINSIKKNYNPLSYDLVDLEEIPEKEGVLFKHTNYLIKFVNPATNVSSSVIRRYSDFLWLQEVLIKKYPFRMIPELPPKKLVSTNKNDDVLFMSRRKKSLVRFLNLLVKHPFMKEDSHLIKFLSIEKDLNSWKKQVEDEPLADEFLNKQSSTSFKKIWKREYADNWNTANNSINNMIEIWNKIGVILERQEKKIKQIAHERSILHQLIDKLSETTPNLYPIEINNTILDINNSLSIINSNISKTIEICDEETKEYSSTIVPSFKKFIELLNALKDLFERYNIIGGNNILQLYKHVEANMSKLEAMKGKPDVSGAEYDKLKGTILYDKKLILEQTNRLWLIRECIMEEFMIFQQSQYLISSSFKTWVKVNSNYTGMQMNIWESLMDQIIDIPTFE